MFQLFGLKQLMLRMSTTFVLPKKEKVVAAGRRLREGDSYYRFSGSGRYDRAIIRSVTTFRSKPKAAALALELSDVDWTEVCHGFVQLEYNPALWETTAEFLEEILVVGFAQGQAGKALGHVLEFAKAWVADRGKYHELIPLEWIAKKEVRWHFWAALNPEQIFGAVLYFIRIDRPQTALEGVAQLVDNDDYMKLGPQVEQDIDCFKKFYELQSEDVKEFAEPIVDILTANEQVGIGAA